MVRQLIPRGILFAILACIKHAVPVCSQNRGYRGGFIFPFFAAGAAFGRALTSVLPGIPVQLSCLCFAAGINVSITRTSLASSIILCYLSGEQQAMPGVLAASLCALFATSYMPFIKSQIVRSDLDSSLFYMKGRDKNLQDSYADLEALSPSQSTA